MVQIADPIAFLLSRHEAFEFGRPGAESGNSLSGWQCTNPFAGDLLKKTAQRAQGLDPTHYAYLEDDIELIERVQATHLKLDGFASSAVFCGAGSSQLLFSICAFLTNRNITELYYLPPIYFLVHYFSKLLGIRARPVSARHAFEPDFQINLPPQNAALLITDPIWYAGIPIPEPVVKKIKDWQIATRSLVIVDGSFQYMPWNLRPREITAQFEPSLTIRVISPTKSLGVHGYRFAYLLLPIAFRAAFSVTYTSIFGSASCDSVAFAHEAMIAVSERTITDSLMSMASKVHNDLREGKIIESIIQPCCGHFVFERILSNLHKNIKVMDETYFEQNRFPDYVRINLLSPSINSIYK